LVLDLHSKDIGKDPKVLIIKYSYFIAYFEKVSFPRAKYLLIQCHKNKEEKNEKFKN
jgi:hypothetical protein